jgi:hypothetical protein
MKKVIYLASMLITMMICLASCGKSKDPVPTGTSTSGGTQASGNGGY